MKRSLSLTVLAAMLSTAVLSSAAYIYSCGDTATFLGFTLFAAIYTVILFCVFEFLKRKNKTLLSVIVITGLFLLASFAAVTLNDVRPYGDMLQWFMDPQKFTRIYQGGIASIILLFGMVLDAAMFYFTKIQFRAIYIFLICMCPFSLFAKTFTDIPVLYTVIVTTLFFTLLMLSGGNKKGSGAVTRGTDISMIPALIGFFASVTVISAFFPKLEYAPYRKEFDELITGMQIGVNGIADFNDFSNNSSNISSNSDEKEKVVFKVYGDAPQYIKRQCFNLYNGQNNIWEYFGDANTGSPYWAAFTLFEDPKALYDASGFDGGKTSERKCFIVSQAEKVRALYTQENTLAIKFDDRFNLNIYRTELSEYFLVNGLAEYPSAYSLTWADFDVSPQFSEFFTKRKATELANDDIIAAKAYLNAEEEARKYDNILLDPATRRECYKSDKGFNEVNALTAEITADCRNDYEKAKAIEQYFKSDMFVYDEDFTTSDASPENFIFRTRRGICTNYATAMTLMCREAGLTARYVEGFMRGDYNESERCYMLTVGDAHAYVQVWIDGYGWTDFDPTSSNIDGGYNSATFLYIGITAVIIAAAAAIVMFMMPRVKRANRLKQIKRSDVRRRYIMAYNAMSSDYNLFIGTKQNSLTPLELAERSAAELGFDIKSFITEYERCVYGGDESGLSTDCAGICADYYRYVQKADKERRKAERAKRKKKK